MPRKKPAPNPPAPVDDRTETPSPAAPGGRAEKSSDSDRQPAARTTDFEVGRYYSPAFVASLFGFTAEWARKECRPGGRFPNAAKLTGGRSWLIPGGDVLAVIGKEQLERDRAAMAAALPTPAQERREADAIFRRLQAQKKARKPQRAR